MRLGFVGYVMCCKKARLEKAINLHMGMIGSVEYYGKGEGTCPITRWGTGE